jgi:hypothetical protein
MEKLKPGLFGIKKSNRDFTDRETWGKNQFNSSFPAALANYLYSKNLEAEYIKISDKQKITHDKISIFDLYGIAPDSEKLFFSFEEKFMPYQKLVKGTLPRIDLVTINTDDSSCLRGIEVKLTALPDNATCDLSHDKYGSEIVTRPDTIVYLACGLATQFIGNEKKLTTLLGNACLKIKDWTEAENVLKYIEDIADAFKEVFKYTWEKQYPVIMHPVWKTDGKILKLADNCLDVIVWSNLAFIKLFLDSAVLDYKKENRKISRQTRTVIWLYKMLLDFSINKYFDHKKIIDELSYNTRNDKAFAVNGLVTHPYMKSDVLTKPRIGKNELKNIILGGGEKLLSPERRFDAVIYSSPELFK